MSVSQDPVFTPEQEIILWAIRVDHARDERVAGILKKGISWDYLRETAVWHGVIPLLYKRLKTEMQDLVPPDELTIFQDLFRENAMRNIRMTQHLLYVLDLLAGSGVPAMPYKGPALAVQAYGDVSMRTFCDLDILIHSSDVSRAYNILTGKGYVLRNPGQMNIERRFGFLDQKDINFMFQGDLLEVHWKVIEQFLAVSFDMDRIWDRSRQVCINGREIRTISPEDMIILLCFHGHKHGWQSLGWLADLVYTISNNPELPWNDLLVFAETLGLRRIVLTGLFLAHQYGGIDFRPDIENLVTTDKKVQNLAREIQYSMFLCRELAIGQIFYLKSRERLMDKARFLGYYPANRLLVFVRWVIRPFTNRQIPSKKDQKNPDTI